MTSFIFGYNLRSNLGDDLMLLSNLRFCELYRCDEVYVIDWRVAGDIGYLHDVPFEYTVLKRPPNLQGIFRLLADSSAGDLFLFGGGNLFDNRKMGFFLFLLALASAIFGRRVYLRGVGFGVKHFYSRLLGLFPARFRDRSISSYKPVIRDTASWAINRLRNEVSPQPKNFDLLVVPRAINHEVDRRQEKLLHRHIAPYSRILVCLMGIDSIEREKQIYRNLVADASDSQKFELYIYRDPAELTRLMSISQMCITLRLHVGMLWADFYGFTNLLVIPYSNKHRFAFPDKVLDDSENFSDLD